MSKWSELTYERMKPEELGIGLFHLEIEDLMPVFMLCNISILFTMLWLLIVFEYVRLRDKQDYKHKAENHY